MFPSIQIVSVSVMLLPFPPDCEAANICVELRQLDERVGELAQLADQLGQGLKLGLSRPSTYLAGANQH